ncbi:hypothetical protein [Sorangium cellulosum]|uniref:hypothetical protein n=1 Tax=Sorangium TaxID=39643 RepID=UPI002691FBD5
MYAREGVRHAWLVEPVKRTLEAFSLVPGPGWERGPVDRDAACVRLVPFEAIELDLSVLWAT